MNNKKSSAIHSHRVLARVRQLFKRSVRDSEGCFWIEGVRQFVQAFDARHSFDTVIYSPILLQSPLAEMLIRRLGAAEVSRVKVSPEQFRSISKAERVSGIGAIVRQRWTPIEQADASRGLCWLVIEDLRSAGNLGTILRTAEAAGAAGAIFLGSYCDPFDPAVVRASMGGIFHLSLVRTGHEQLKQWLHAGQVQLVGLSPRADRLWTDLPSVGATALAIGEERGGLSQRLRDFCQTTVRLPMTGQADSLNAGIAAGVMMYELVRRQQEPQPRRSRLPSGT